MILNSPYITGSITVTGNANIQGQLTVTGSLSGIASTASFALTLGGTGSVGFATTGAFTAASGSASSRLTQIEQVYATTGSNSFRATQSITGSLTVTGQIIAQTLNVQQVTSSIVFSSGSNTFGCDLNSRQTFTGSVLMTGSLVVNTTGPELQVNNSGVTIGNLLTDNHSITGSLRITGSLNVFGNISSSGNLRIDKDQPDIQLNILSASQFSRVYFFEGASGNGGVQLIGSSFAGSRKCRFEIFGSNAGISLVANGQFETPGMFISGSNVGIGTITPCTRLEVSSTAASADRTLPHNVLTITAEQGNAPYFPFGGAILFKNRSYTSGLVESSRIRSVIYDDGAPANCGGGLWFETTRTPGGTLTPSLVINYAGNVGIGTCTPSTTLTVKSTNGNGYALTRPSNDTVEHWRLSTTETGGDAYTVAYNTFNNEMIFTTYAGGGTGGNIILRTGGTSGTIAERMRITNTGRVGIATPNPGAQLDIYQTAGPGTAACDALYLRAGNNSDVFCHNQILFSYNAGTDYAHAIKTRHNSNNAIDNAFDFYTWRCGDAAATKAGQYVMTIAGNGRVGIGTCAPSTTLHVAGNVTFNNTISSPGNFIATAGLNAYLRPASGYRVFIDTGDGLTVTGNISKGSGSFKIKHPLDSKKCTHRLVHSFIEGPQADLIYSGHTALQNGISCINMDCAARMTEGTFLALNRCLRVFTTNETSWDQVKGRVIGNILIVESQNTESNDEISWMVIGERQDEHMLETEWTDEQGRVITEPEIVE